MEFVVVPKVGQEVPVEWRAQGIEQIFIVTRDGAPIAVFFDADEANAYVVWLKMRLAKQKQRELDDTPSP